MASGKFADRGARGGAERVFTLRGCLKKQSGFTMAEALVAVFLFTATVSGISMMMISGGGQVIRGSMDTTATALASEKIEEVKSLPFYRPWEGYPQDIDDSYYNIDYDNAEQLDHPGSDEPYNTIAGHSNYRRTTAVQYQYINRSDPDNKQLAPASMYTDWVSREPEGVEIDRPLGGAGPTDREALHGLLIEVKIYYQTEYGERVYAERALAGDLLVTGGANNPVLVVTAIETVPTTTPPSTYVGDNPVTIKVYVDAPGLDSSSTVEVGFWYAGRKDIAAVSARPSSRGVITCTFDFREVRAGIYNIYVYWVDEGWLDKSFRECFTVLQEPPEITRVDSFDWGYREQTSRRITLHGYNLSNPASVSLVWPRTGEPEYTCTGSIVESGQNYVIANMNLTSVPDDPSYWNERWSVVVVTSGGTYRSREDDERVLINPAPEAVSFSRTSGFRKVRYTGVNVTGRYFQSVPGNPRIRLVKTATWPVPGDTPYIELSGGTFNEDYASTGITNMTLNMAAAGFKRWSGGAEVPAGEVPGRYYLQIRNPDGQNILDTGRYCDISHAPMQITSPASWTGYHNYWDVAIGQISGSYFDPSYTTVAFIKDGAPFNPENTDTITGGVVVNGSYGASQNISTGLMANLINIPPGTYKLRVTDTENGQHAERNFTVSYGPPGVPYYISPTSVQDDGTRTISVRAKGLYGSSRYTVDFQRMVWIVVWVHDAWVTVNSAWATTVVDRPNRFTQITAGIAVPYKYPALFKSFLSADGAQPRIRAENGQGTSGWWEGGRPQVVD